MGQAREIMDGITSALLAGDRDTLLRLYAADAVAEAPDTPRIEGAAAIADYLLTFARAFPDASFESMRSYESGDTAIDEGVFVGTHTAVLSTPEGDLPPTGRSVRLRECDVLEVRNGVGVVHRFYFDQLAYMTQLGLTEADVGAAAVPQPRAAEQAAEQPTAG